MNLSEVSFGDARPIDSYGPAGFRIAGQLHAGALFVHPNGITPWGGFDDPSDLVAAAEAIDILLIGTGADIAPIPDALRTSLEAAGIGVEIMATGPACRTYNVLLAEGRRIGAAVLPV